MCNEMIIENLTENILEICVKCFGSPEKVVIYLEKVSRDETPAKNINDNELPSHADYYIPAVMAPASCPFTANPVPHQEHR